MVGPTLSKQYVFLGVLFFLFVLFSFLFGQLFIIIWKMSQVFKKVINETTGFPVTNVLSFSVKSCMFYN